ncbi:AAA domain-containing protein [Pseudonocardia oroxyli]|uniref:AAA domain-containing protein n=1 Tax=Pseudonocardia oroxyli TaxID=366584 RepID=A0A1G7YKS4_PSEOR|nr:AAA domain-containing protein [Pseudonocardia oroxyli]
MNLGKRDEIVQLESIIRTGGFEFIVIDTLNRCSVGLDENSAKDMGMVVEALYDLKRATPRDMGAIALIHHTGKDGKTVRGSSALEAGFDTVYTTSREGDDGPVTLRRTKRKDGPPDDAMVLTWHSVSETGSGVVVQPDRGTLVEWDNPAKSDRAVLAAIVGFAPGLGSTPTQVAADTGLNLRTVKRALTRLAGAGLAERCDGRGNWRATGLGEATSKIEK